MTYKISSFYKDFKESETRSEIKRAFDYWTQASGLKFEEVLVSRPADMVIDFAKMDHTDGYPFDGRGGDLAHAFFPQDGRIHFDMDELFTLNSTDYNFRLIAAHEIGHALGVEHIFEQGSLMYPYYSGYVDGSPLAPVDVDAIKTLYGELDFY